MRILSMLLGFLWSASVFGLDLRFEQAAYQVGAGESYQVHVVLDSVPSNGLFSVGVRMNYDTNAVEVVSTNNIMLPPSLNGNGLGDVAFKLLEPGLAGGAGALDFQAASGYDQARVITFQLQNLAETGTVYQLGLELYFDDRANFVAFEDGAVLDGQITNFVSSTVQVISGSVDPDPAVITAFQPPTSMAGMLSFTNRTIAPLDFILEVSTNLIDDLSWQPVNGSTLSTNSPGQFSFSWPPSAAPETVEHYRVQSQNR